MPYVKPSTASKTLISFNAAMNYKETKNLTKRNELNCKLYFLLSYAEYLVTYLEIYISFPKNGGVSIQAPKLSLFDKLYKRIERRKNPMFIAKHMF